MAIPSGVVTFLFTDVEGSTRLWERDATGMAASLVLHDQVMRDEVASRGGHVFSTAGDAFAVHPIAFEAPDIVCAIPEAAMRRVSEHFTSWSDAFASLGDGEGFKHRLLDSLRWKRRDDRLLIAAGLEAIDPSDALPPAFLRAKAEILAWVDSL